MPARRIPPQWTLDETDACFIVSDHNGQALGSSSQLLSGNLDQIFS